MKREIKLRAWDGERMHYPEDNKIEYANSVLSSPRMVGRREKECEIHVMQYTGLKDKNGVDIYEGDILSVVDSFHDRLGNDVKTKFKGFVSFADASFYIKEDVFCRYRWIDYSCEVLGNIHENPELLK